MVCHTHVRFTPESGHRFEALFIPNERWLSQRAAGIACRPPAELAYKRLDFL